MIYLAAEHFVRSPGWTWLILFYFFLAGLSGGSYVLGAMLRLFGRGEHEETARTAFLVAFPLIILCPILLTVDLGQPVRFWHMVIDPANNTLNFKFWSPMSLGVWGLGVYSGFAFLAFAEALFKPLRGLLKGTLGRLILVVGALFALFVCAYTGVLLAVSNQPVWSDGWPIGGLFLASALSGSAALLLLLAGWRLRGASAPSLAAVLAVDRYFVLIEAILVIVFLVTVAAAGTLGRVLSVVGVVLWLVVIFGLAIPFVGHTRSRTLSPVITTVVALAGVLALRAVIIFAA